MLHNWEMKLHISHLSGYHSLDVECKMNPEYVFLGSTKNKTP